MKCPAKYIARLYRRTALKMLLKSADRIIVARGSYLSPYLESCGEKISIIPVWIDVVAFRSQEAHSKGTFSS